jgi:hypothetical protein
MQSALLTDFWGRPILIRAAEALPAGYAENANLWYPACYDVHGFGGDVLHAAVQKLPEVGHSRAGYSYFSHGESSFIVRAIRPITLSIR